MKRIFFFLFLLCAAIYSQQTYRLVTDEKTGDKMIIGLCDKEVFSDSAFSGWFWEEYNKYKPSEEAIKNLKGKFRDVSINIIFGTWCEDSRRELPRFIKILDAVRYPDLFLALIGVDRNKKAGDFDLSVYDIELVPTFIIRREIEEIGRIIETPENRLEEDLEKIILGSLKED